MTRSAQRCGSPPAVSGIEDGQDRIELPSQSELPLSFGLGTRTSVDRVEIEWPSGGREDLKSLPAGVSYVIVEGKGITSKAPLSTR